MPRLHIDMMSFREADREAWKRGSGQRAYVMRGLPRSSFLRRMIEFKALIRQNRFFGETLVATAWPKLEPARSCWYSSYKWLTNAAWTGPSEPPGDLAREFKKALGHHFPGLRDVQSRAQAFVEQTGIRPVPPDLWVVSGNCHWFLECKIPPDNVDDHQLAGLSVIACCLPAAQRGTRDIKVGVVYLQNESGRFSPNRSVLRRKFRGYCEELSSMK